MKTATKDKIMDLSVDLIVIGILIGFCIGILEVISIIFEWSFK
jgi:F0F1-type ATP synthase assembly protein I